MKLRGKKAKNNVIPRKPAGAKSGSEMSRILVPIDFSDHSKKALNYAISFAGKFNSELILVYVVEPTIYPADFSFGQIAVPSIENELRERGKAELDNLANTLVSESTPVKTIVRTGKPYLEIIKTAEEEGIDIIIIATHGHSGVEHLLFGGTTEKVVRKAPCPVLIVRPVEKSKE
jgi:universal stress protein A